MDQIKIGRFIAQCRKERGFTQMQLAEKLNITDRAVSKWETGRAMPDSSLMIDLCTILNISVNDLLCGEVVTADDYTRELENNLLQMIKEKEKSDKHLLVIEWVIGILSIIILLIPIIIAAYLPMEDKYRIILAFSGFIPALVGFGFAVRIEQVAGYYECAKCKHRYVPTYKAINLAPHMGRTRYLKCPNCGEKSWNKKVISKEETK
ncbi:MAG: helix-turn-helix transcriptional regulator [Clostridiales bacterium]|nr:helix-turn-helix transcriptional regulator [Clostridiales bacterium]